MILDMLKKENVQILDHVDDWKRSDYRQPTFPRGTGLCNARLCKGYHRHHK